MTPVPSATNPAQTQPARETPVVLGVDEPGRPRHRVRRDVDRVVPLSSDTLRHRIVCYLSDKLDSDVELGDLHFRAFPRLRVEGADLRIRKRGLADYPPLISIKSFHVDANIVGLYRKHVDHVRLDGLDINIAPSQARDKLQVEERSEKLEGEEATSGGTASRRSRAIRSPMPASSSTAIDTVDARVIILPFEKDKEPKVWAIHELHMRDLGLDAAVAVRGDADQRRPAGRDRHQGQVRPVAARRTGRHAARWHLHVRERGPQRLQGHLRNAVVARRVRRHAGGARRQRRDRHAGLHDRGRRPSVPAAHEVPGDHRRHQRRHAAPNIDARFLKSSLVAKGAVIDAPKGSRDAP